MSKVNIFENMNEIEARSLILNQVRAYCEQFHKKPEYRFGDRIAYAGRVYDSDEMVNLVDASLEFWLTSGRYVDEFERRFGEYLGVPFVSLVNSGSSANLCAFMALTANELGDRKIKPGDEVITVAAGFPTTVSPIVQFGAIPVFVDVTIPQYNIDTSMLEQAYSEKTKAVMLAHTLGNPFDIQGVKDFCDKYNLWLIEDNCDALGSECIYNGEKRMTGTIGDIGTSSFYPPHHVTLGEGGAVFTSNPLLHRLIRSFRDWGRDCVCPSGKDNLCGHRFEGQFGELPKGYDHKYVYSHFGYNLKVTDLQASVGCAQLNKLEAFIAKRRHNFKRLTEGLLELSDKLTLAKPLPGANPSWFGCLIICKDGVSRNNVVNYLENNNVQTRMLFAGNIVKHPCFDEMRMNASGYRIVGDLTNTDIIMNDGFWLGVYPGLTDEMIDDVVKLVKEAVSM